MNVACCLFGAETNDGVHDWHCPQRDTIPQVTASEVMDPDPVVWVTLMRQPALRGEPVSAAGRWIKWWPRSQPYEGVGWHIWRGDRGPYSLCHRPGCRLAYSRWSGDECRDIGPWQGPVLPTPREIVAILAPPVS